MSSEAKASRPLPRLRNGIARPEHVPRRKGRSVGNRIEVAAPDPVVIDDLPEEIPVTARELDAIETYLGILLAKLVGGTERTDRADLADEGVTR